MRCAVVGIARDQPGQVEDARRSPSSARASEPSSLRRARRRARSSTPSSSRRGRARRAPARAPRRPARPARSHQVLAEEAGAAGDQRRLIGAPLAAHRPHSARPSPRAAARDRASRRARASAPAGGASLRTAASTRRDASRYCSLARQPLGRRAQLRRSVRSGPMCAAIVALLAAGSAPFGSASCVPVQVHRQDVDLVRQREVAERRLEVGHHAGLASACPRGR